MRFRGWHFGWLFAFTIGLEAGAPDSPASVPRTAVEIFQGILKDLQEYDHRGRPAAVRRIEFEFPEALVNQYLVASMVLRPRPMVERLQVTLVGQNHFIVDARINFDAVRKSTLEAGKAEMRRFSGVRSLRAGIRFRVDPDGLDFEAKSLPSEVLLPNHSLAELIRVVAANQPEKLNTRRKIPLPFGLRRAWTTDKVAGGATY
jgi:hypothetical protein